MLRLINRSDVVMQRLVEHQVVVNVFDQARARLQAGLASAPPSDLRGVGPPLAILRVEGKGSLLVVHHQEVSVRVIVLGVKLRPQHVVCLV